MTFSRPSSNLLECDTWALGDTERSIATDRLARIRADIQNRLVSFPSQVPVFARQYRPDVQWHVVALYFVQGWSCEQLAHRSGVTTGRIRQMIHKWVDRVTEFGYLQRIPPQDIDAALTLHAGSFSSTANAMQPIAQQDSKRNNVPTQYFAD